ncbi:MAG: hypothetical protein GX640_06790 [Fibrobacter sp.]|nr:hypothetical protein [Fibrobacter sp.]
MKTKDYATAGTGTGSFIGGIFFILTMVISLNAGIFFQDDFTDVARSYKNWIVISASDSQAKFSDGHLEVINTSPTYFSLAIHTMPKGISDYTFSATVSSLNPGAGLYFDFMEKEDGYHGFCTFVDDESIYLYKLTPDSSTLLAHIGTPFIKPVENRLCVSKSSGRILLFCNSFFIFSIPDSISPPGSVGFIVHPSNRAVFDDVIMTDDGADSMKFAPFHDNFQDENSFGWIFDGNANVKRGGGLLNIETSFSQRYCSGLKLYAGNFQMHTVVSFERGDNSSFYGFYIKSGTDTSEPFYIFTIAADNHYASGHLNSLMDSLPVSGMIPDGMLRGNRDSLALIFDENRYKFLVNGRVVSVKDGIGVVHEIGLFVSKKLNISVFGFCLENSPLAVANRNIFRLEKRQPNAAKKTSYIDILGRNIKNDFRLFYPNQILVEIKDGKAKKELKLGNMLR